MAARTILRNEWRLLMAYRPLRIVLGLFVILLGYALTNGVLWLRFQERTVQATEAGNAERVLAFGQELEAIENGAEPSSPFADPRSPLVLGGPSGSHTAVLEPGPLTAQREASNDAVNRRSELLARYLEDHPEMAEGVVADEPGLGALSWAATDAVNRRLEEVTAEHDARRDDQIALVRRYRFLSPAILAQEALLDAAGTGDARFAHFQSEVRSFAEQWREFFVPAVLAGAQMSARVLPDSPRFRLEDEEPAEVARRATVPLAALGGLLVLVGTGAGVGLGRVRGAD